MSATTTTRVTQLTDVDTKLQAFATAYLLLEASLLTDHQANHNGPVHSGLNLADLRRDIVCYMAGLGLQPVVGDSFIAHAAGTAADKSGTFLTRWTTKINQLVP